MPSPLHPSRLAASTRPRVLRLHPFSGGSLGLSERPTHCPKSSARPHPRIPSSALKSAWLRSKWFQSSRVMTVIGVLIACHSGAPSLLSLKRGAVEPPVHSVLYRHSKPIWANQNLSSEIKSHATTRAWCIRILLTRLSGPDSWLCY